MRGQLSSAACPLCPEGYSRESMPAPSLHTRAFGQKKLSSRADWGYFCQRRRVNGASTMENFMPRLQRLLWFFALLFGLSAVAKPQAKPQAKPPAAPLQKQNARLLVPKLAQLEPLYAFASSLEKALGSAEIHDYLGKTGLYPLLLPATQAAWTQKGIATDKPLVVQTQPNNAFACMGVADDKALAAVIDALPGEEKAAQQGTLRYRAVRTGPEHASVLFWNSSQLCVRPHQAALTAASLAKALEKTLADASALSKTAAKQTWPLLSAGADMQLFVEPLSAQQLRLRLNAANMPWKLKTTQGGKTTLASVSTDAGLLLKLQGIPASEIFRHTDFIAALTPKEDALLPQKQAWFSGLMPLLAEEFLVKLDFPEGRHAERLLLMAKLKTGSESAYDAWLSQMPKGEAAAADVASLPTQRGPLALARKGSWAFATTHPELALTQVESLEKAKPDTAAAFVGLMFPKTLEAVLQGETFASFAMGLSSKQMRLMRFNAPLRNLFNSIHLIRLEALPKANNAAELLVDISLSP